MSNKLRVGIIFGGKSAEHEVSLRSAQNVIDALDKEKYEPVLIRVEKNGEFPVAFTPEHGALICDVAFPVLHGPFGEDGTVQGMLKLANIPFVGASVLGSAVGMDKDVMKRLLRDAGLPIGKFLVVRGGETCVYADTVATLGLPLFVKPANLGSSVGISKVRNEEEFYRAIADAFLYDRKILLEEFIKGREIECAVLGNEQPVASVPGEIIPHHEFYSYEAKYLDENGAGLETPANLSDDLIQKVQTLAVRAFRVLECEGLGRVDFFLKPNDDVVINEINTIPGFTSISMYPKMWEASGMSYTQLVDRLIELALERFAKEQKLKTSVSYSTPINTFS